MMWGKTYVREAMLIRVWNPMLSSLHVSLDFSLFYFSLFFTRASFTSSSLHVSLDVSLFYFSLFYSGFIHIFLLGLHSHLPSSGRPLCLLRGGGLSADAARVPGGVLRQARARGARAGQLLLQHPSPLRAACFGAEVQVSLQPLLLGRRGAFGCCCCCWWWVLLLLLLLLILMLLFRYAMFGAYTRRRLLVDLVVSHINLKEKKTPLVQPESP